MSSNLSFPCNLYHYICFFNDHLLFPSTKIDQDLITHFLTKELAFLIQVGHEYKNGTVFTMINILKRHYLNVNKCGVTGNLKIKNKSFLIHFYC